MAKFIYGDIPQPSATGEDIAEFALRRLALRQQAEQRKLAAAQRRREMEQAQEERLSREQLDRERLQTQERIARMKITAAGEERTGRAAATAARERRIAGAMPRAAPAQPGVAPTPPQPPPGRDLTFIRGGEVVGGAPTPPPVAAPVRAPTPTPGVPAAVAAPGAAADGQLQVLMENEAAARRLAGDVPSAANNRDLASCRRGRADREAALREVARVRGLDAVAGGFAQDIVDATNATGVGSALQLAARARVGRERMSELVTIGRYQRSAITARETAARQEEQAAAARRGEEREIERGRVARVERQRVGLERRFTRAAQQILAGARVDLAHANTEDEVLQNYRTALRNWSAECPAERRGDPMPNEVADDLEAAMNNARRRVGGAEGITSAQFQQRWTSLSTAVRTDLTTGVTGARGAPEAASLAREFMGYLSAQAMVAVREGVGRQDFIARLLRHAYVAGPDPEGGQPNNAGRFRIELVPSIEVYARMMWGIWHDSNRRRRRR